jgi:hypothetical protein
LSVRAQLLIHGWLVGCMSTGIGAQYLPGPQSWVQQLELLAMFCFSSICMLCDHSETTTLQGRRDHVPGQHTDCAFEMDPPLQTKARKVYNLVSRCPGIEVSKRGFVVHRPVCVLYMDGGSFNRTSRLAKAWHPSWLQAPTRLVQAPQVRLHDSSSLSSSSAQVPTSRKPATGRGRLRVVSEQKRRIEQGAARQHKLSTCGSSPADIPRRGTDDRRHMPRVAPLSSDAD